MRRMMQIYLDKADIWNSNCIIFGHILSTFMKNEHFLGTWFLKSIVHNVAQNQKYCRKGSERLQT